MPTLDPNRWQAASPYLDQALDLPEQERAAWLKALRAQNPALAADVETLLGEHDTLSRRKFLEDGPTPLPPSDPGLQAGETIGPYCLLQRIGEGGMGEVWLADQASPVRRQVALKVIKQGMDTRQVIARFEAERQALALMDHPCVAKVIEAGSTPQGKPYFAMEYVRGNPITDYCDRHRLTPRERLELFVLLCEGVQHAHQKAIIHRDLKPSNVLVVEQDGRLLPKVIDFGVAKATAQRLTEKTMFTELGVLIGTPEYMSPEQAGLTGEDVDTRTDVYSLGVILYEMLVGALPFDPKELRSGGFEGIRRMIREDEPKRPSTRFATLGERSGESARRRRTDPSSLLRLLRGDLDWIAHFTTDPVVAGAANALVYTLTVTNPGPSVVPASQAVTVVDTLPLEAGGWMATGTDWSCAISGTGVSGDPYVASCDWTGAALGVGDSADVLTLTGTVDAGTALTSMSNTATVDTTTDPTGPNLSNTVMTGVIAESELTLMKSGPGSVMRGVVDALAYTLTVMNPGPSVVPASQTVTVVDTLPLETSGWMAAGTDWSPMARSCTYTLPRHPSSTARVARLPLTRSEHMADSERTASGCRWRSRGGRSPT
jgi:serine/threonine protein kinase